MANSEQGHSIETYKSLIQLSIEGLKILLILNGGAAVALLAYLGNIAGKVELLPDMRLPMMGFIVGLVSCALAFLTTYLTQLSLFNEPTGTDAIRFFSRHQVWLWISIALALISISAFAIGSFTSARSFRQATRCNCSPSAVPPSLSRSIH